MEKIKKESIKNRIVNGCVAVVLRKGIQWNDSRRYY